MTIATTPTRVAETSVPLHPLLAGRWSPRAFDPEHRISAEHVTSLLEAARWAPSASNTQPWRFLVAHRGDEDFSSIAEHLAPGNKSWATRASLLVVAAARQIDDRGNPLPWALYDTGQAVAAMTTQAHSHNLFVHQMGGFSVEGVRTAFALDSDITPVVVAAIGRHDPLLELPEQLADRERAPRSRMPLESLLLSGRETNRAAA